MNATISVNYTERRHFTANAIARAIERAIRGAGEVGVFVTVTNLREGREDCGSGTVLFDSSIEVLRSDTCPSGRYGVNNRSQWANYGHPSGMEYRIDLDISLA